VCEKFHVPDPATDFEGYAVARFADMLRQELRAMHHDGEEQRAFRNIMHDVFGSFTAAKSKAMDDYWRRKELASWGADVTGEEPYLSDEDIPF
jgi:hypothetical protein